MKAAFTRAQAPPLPAAIVASLLGASLMIAGCQTTGGSGPPGGSPGGPPSGSSSPSGGGSAGMPSPTSSPSGGMGMPSTPSGGSSMPSPSTGSEPSLPSAGTQSSGTSGSATPESGKSPSGSPGSASTGQAGKATTSDERRAAIDRKLDDSLGTLDREIRKEQEKTAQERDARAAANAGNGTADSGDKSDDADSNGKRDGDLKSGSADTEGPKDGKGKDGDRKARPGDLKSDKAGKDGNGKDSGGGAQGNGSAAPSIPDGSDDDIVARRLRKAAEQETDPELKEKLWKEYVEYKKNSGK